MATCVNEVSRSAQLNATIYTARLKPLRHQRWDFIARERGFWRPNRRVHRNKASSTKPAAAKRVLPMVMGGQNRTKYLTPVLLAPHKNTLNNRPAAMAPLLGFVSTGTQPASALPRTLSFIDDHHAVIGQDHAAAQFHITVGDRIDADDVGLAHLFQKSRNKFVESVPAHFLAVRSFKRFDAHGLVAIFGHHVQRAIGLLDEGFLGQLFMDGNGEVSLDLNRGGGGFFLGDGRRPRLFRDGNRDGALAGRAFNRRPRSGRIDFQLLLAIRAFKADVHNQTLSSGLLRSSYRRSHNKIEPNLRPKNTRTRLQISSGTCPMIYRLMKRTKPVRQDPASPRQVFVVDDNSTLVEFATAVLESAGHKVRPFCDPKA